MKNIPQVMIDQAKYLVSREYHYDASPEQVEKNRKRAITAIREYRETRDYLKNQLKEKNEIAEWLKSIGEYEEPKRVTSEAGEQTTS